MELRVEVPIEKADADRRLAFGFANVFRTTEGDAAVVDSHREVIDSAEAIAAIEDAVYRYVLESRDGDEQHVNYGVAKLVESIVLTAEKREAFALHAAQVAALAGADAEQVYREKLDAAEAVLPDGWWVGFKVLDSDVWAKVKDGTYSMFSIVGRGRRVPIDA